MSRLVLLLTIFAACVLIPWGESHAAEPKPPMRGVLVGIGPDFAGIPCGVEGQWGQRGRGAARRRGEAAMEADGRSRRAGGDDTCGRGSKSHATRRWPTPTPSGWPRSAGTMTTGGGGSRHAPAAKRGEVIKAWPWVPIGYAPAFDAHRQRLKLLLGDLPGSWAGVFLNDLQAGPSSCGCGNDQCRWALDYGSPPTAAKTPGDDAAARIVAELSAGHPGKVIIPVWVTECELADLPDAKGGTGLCGRVRCAANDCWPRYARNWNPLLKATDGPIALGVWPETFRRDAARWIESDLALFQKPLRGGSPLAADRTIAVIQAWGKPESAAIALSERVERAAAGWVLALDAIDQSWEPRAVALPKER